MSSVPKAVHEVSNEVRQFLPTFRQQYRALLREASYLPDSAARSFVHDSIVKRYNPFNPKNSIAGCGAPIIFDQKRINLEGSDDDLQHVLLRTYGRAGRRRRELLSRLLKPGEDEMPQDDTALSRMIDSQIGINLDASKDVDINRPLDVSKRQRREQTQITKFLASQQEINPMESLRGRIKKLKPDIPLTNSWGRVLPAKRKENMKKTWWANLLERVLPPLPEHEWNRLADLAEGRQPIEELLPRRKAATPRNLENPVKGTEKMNSLFTTPARVHANVHGEALHRKNLTNSEAKADRARQMRRLYGMVWSLSSKMVQDENTKEYTITWGGQRSPAAAGKLTQPSSEDLELFQVPEDGLTEGSTNKKTRKTLNRQKKRLQ